MSVNQTAHDCPDCGDLLLADDSKGQDNVEYECPGCGSEFEGFIGKRSMDYVVERRLDR